MNPPEKTNYGLGKPYWITLPEPKKIVIRSGNIAPIIKNEMK